VCVCVCVCIRHRQQQTNNRWLVCVCVVKFDLDMGQMCESMYPQNSLSAQETTDVCNLAFPDSHSMHFKGDTTFSLRFPRETRSHIHNTHTQKGVRTHAHTYTDAQSKVCMYIYYILYYICVWCVRVCVDVMFYFGCFVVILCVYVCVCVIV